MPHTSPPADDVLATIADLLELAARRVWGWADSVPSAPAHAAGLALYLASSRVQARLSTGHERSGIDPAADDRSSLLLLGTAEAMLGDLERTQRSDEWHDLRHELRALNREVRSLEQ